MSTPIQVLTHIATDWARRCFGNDHVVNVQVRSIRNLEETTELAQALGVSRETALLTINSVYDRPVGDIDQEIGGTLLTGVVLCEALGKDPEDMLEREVLRVLKKSPEHFAKRNQAKIDMGLDAPAQSSGALIAEPAEAPDAEWIESSPSDISGGYVMDPGCGPNKHASVP